MKFIRTSKAAGTFKLPSELDNYEGFLHIHLQPYDFGDKQNELWRQK